MNLYDSTIKANLDEKLEKLENEFKSDVIFFYGAIDYDLIRIFRDFIERLRQKSAKKYNTLTIFLNTPGGRVETVEKLVEIIRHHYECVNFVVPDIAFSAGTIFCMSGDNIYMDYSSSLGPIDPQFYNGTEWVPALGYLDQVEKLIEKSKNGTLTDAEFAILQNQDLAKLSSYEQQKNLTITLLKEWLVKYHFKGWVKHPDGKTVTKRQKSQKAITIARLLSDNKLWHSHGRLIGISKIKELLELNITDYSADKPLREMIISYNDLITEFIVRNNYTYFLHHKYYW